MTLSGDFITKIRMFYHPNEADKGVYNYFFDGEKYGVEEPAGGGGRRYAGPFTLRGQSSLIGNSVTTLFGFESAAPSGGELMYLNNPASNIGTENPYLAVVYHKDHLGSTRSVTKTDGTILEQNDYYPFGLRTTRGENYSTLSQSLAAIAQSANNTAANTAAPEYLYSGKEKQEFIRNTSAVINAGGSTDYTSNYLDYGARFYNPTTLRWNTQDPMAEKYQRYSPYNYCVNNPINLVDPNGEDWYQYTDEDGNTKTMWCQSQDETYTDKSGNVWNNIGENYLSIIGDNATLFTQHKNDRGELYLNSSSYNLTNEKSTNELTSEIKNILSNSSSLACGANVLLKNSVATFRITNSRGSLSFKYYGNGWKGNQWVKPRSISNLGRNVGKLGQGLGLLSIGMSLNALSNSNTLEDTAEHGLDIFMGVASFIPVIGPYISLYWSLGGRSLHYRNLHEGLIPQIQNGINPGLPEYQPFK